MSSLENLLLELLIITNQSQLETINYQKKFDICEIVNQIDIGFNTKYMKFFINYNDLIEELKKLQQNKFPNKIKKIIDITNDFESLNYYCLNSEVETYNNILYDIKNYYICEINEKNKKFFFNIIGKKKIKKNSKYAIIFNNKNIYLICLKNKLETIILELEKNIELFGTPDDIIDSDEFITEMINYSINNNIQINNLTEQITKISIDSKVNMINTFIYDSANTNTKKFKKYINDINELIISLDKNKIYICKTTINTLYFISIIFDNYDFPYNSIMFPIQNSTIILTPNVNLHINSLKNFSGIFKSRINVLFENILKKTKLIECNICYKKSKKNNICFECYQFNGCVPCGNKMIKKNMFDCVLCKS
jgi:hypothetical protein